MKIVTIIGARPQFIKASMISKELATHQTIQEIIIHTGQHFDDNMSQVFFEDMYHNQPRYYLGINKLNHGSMTGRMLEKIEQTLLDEQPELILVFGDTNSTLAGALAAAKIQISVAHIEAGLRSFNRKMPEEINRVLTDHLADILFAPTLTAVENLKNEGISEEKIKYVGDVMYDAALHFGNIATKKSNIVNDLHLGSKSFVLCTVHRQENTDRIDRLKSIIKALNIINREIVVVVPLHPRTQRIIENEGIEIEFRAIDPVGYFDMLVLLQSCKLVLTDSGGLQKEAFFSQKHCVTLRDETEWVELVEHGFTLLAGANISRIIEAYQKMIKKSSNFKIELYGNGNSRKTIVGMLIR